MTGKIMRKAVAPGPLRAPAAVPQFPLWEALS
jgi:hypothetical protein